MFITNGIDAILIKNNRNESSVYDDQDKQEENIVCCPYNVDQAVKFGLYTVPEAKGYFILKHTAFFIKIHALHSVTIYMIYNVL